MLARGVMLWALYAIPVVVAVRPVAEPVLDPDLWWHLRVGEWVTEHGRVPATDPFTQQGRPWVAYSWLYEVALWNLYQALGLTGVVLYRAVMALAVVAAIHALIRLLEPRFLVATGLTGAAALAVAMLFSERPWLFTILFTTLSLHAVVALRREQPAPRWIWTLPPVFVLWANLHIQFVYGLLVLGLACLTSAFEARSASKGSSHSLARASGSEPASRRRQLFAVSALCLLATLVNPYFARLHGVVVEYATQPGPFRWVNELKAPEFREPGDWVMLALTGAALYALGRRPRSSFEVLFLCGAALLAFRSRRDLWLLVLADVVVLASPGPGAAAEKGATLTPAARALVAVGLLLLAGLKAWHDDLSPGGMNARVARNFPVEAARAVALSGRPGPLYNDFNWGGYLTWSLPGLPVAIDGRTNLHGDERIERYGRVWCGLPGWDDDPDLRAAGVILGPADSALVSLLRRDRRFELLHEDAVACVFVPSDRSGPPPKDNRHVQSLPDR
jgi:hypothetical protein